MPNHSLLARFTPRRSKNTPGLDHFTDGSARFWLGQIFLAPAGLVGALLKFAPFPNRNPGPAGGRARSDSCEARNAIDTNNWNSSAEMHTDILNEKFTNYISVKIKDILWIINIIWQCEINKQWNSRRDFVKFV